MSGLSARFLSCYLLDTSTRKQRKSQYEQVTADSEHELRCIFCGYSITTNADRIPVNAAHEHRCINPAGVEYHIGCFDHAPGCLAIGPATAEHTWFAGYRWQIAVCGNCHEHLGWVFSNGTRFFGLILNRLKAYQ